jgi:hypothetical protein
MLRSVPAICHRPGGPARGLGSVSRRGLRVSGGSGHADSSFCLSGRCVVEVVAAGGCKDFQSECSPDFFHITPYLLRSSKR